MSVRKFMAQYTKIAAPGQWGESRTNAESADSARIKGSGVDLRPLELSAIVHVDRLPLREDIEHGPAPLTVAVPGPPDAAEGHVGFGADRRGVDIRDPRPDVADRLIGLVDVARVDRRGEAVRSVVRDRDGLLERLHLDHGEDRTEDLLPRHAHLGPHTREKRGLEEPYFSAAAGCFAHSSDEYLGSLFPGDLHVSLDRVQLLLVDQRAHLRSRLRPVAHAERLRLLLQHRHELRVNGFMNDEARRGGAPLAGGAEGAPEDSFERELEIGVLHHDLRVLPPHLEGHALPRPAADRKSTRLNSSH